MTFNGDAVPGSPFSCSVLDIGDILTSGDGLTSAVANKPASFTLISHHLSASNVQAWVVCKCSVSTP